MSFVKMNLCGSVQVAINLFHMFRNEQVNRIRGDDGNTAGLYIEEQIPGLDLEESVFSEAVSGGIAYVIRGRYDKVLIHDIVHRKGDYLTETRRVEFRVKSPDWNTACFSIYVSRKFLDNGDDVCDWSAWTLHRADLKHVMQKQVIEIQLEVSYCSNENVHFVSQHRSNINGYVTVRSNTTTTR